LCELFSQLFTQPPSNLAHIQYSFCGIATIIGYIKNQILLYGNIRFFSTLTTTPILGTDDSTLSSKVAAPEAQDSNKKNGPLQNTETGMVYTSCTFFK